MELKCSANPVGLIVLGIIALTAAVVGLVVYWDELNAGVQSLTGGMFDMWDVLLLIMGPIGLVILPFKKLYENIDAVTAAFKTMVNGIIGGINIIVEPLRMLMGGLSSLTGGAIDLTFGDMPMMQDGGTLKSGTAIVGDGGKPEMIKHTSGGTVVTPLPGAKADTSGGGNTALITALQENTAAVKSMMSAMGTGGGDIVLTMDEREFGRAVGKVNKTQNSLRFRY